MNVSAHRDHATHFSAMASPCVVLVDTEDAALAAEIGLIAQTEALRVQRKFSRYQPSVVTTINDRAGAAVEVDDETADLLDYAAQCYELSEGLFDITSGVLRRAWNFAGRGAVPAKSDIENALAHIGWTRVSWDRPRLCLQAGMEIDFGGIGKEYAVDRALDLCKAIDEAAFLINFGGDLRVTGPRRDGSPWWVAIEDVDRAGAAAGLLELSAGALATSGDTHRYVKDRASRYGHVLNPHTGWPIAGAPRSVTVHADTCSEAGLLAKLALLRGAEAEQFLKAEQVRAWCVR